MKLINVTIPVAVRTQKKPQCQYTPRLRRIPGGPTKPHQNAKLRQHYISNVTLVRVYQLPSVLVGLQLAATIGAVLLPGNDPVIADRAAI